MWGLVRVGIGTKVNRTAGYSIGWKFANRGQSAEIQTSLPKRQMVINSTPLSKQEEYKKKNIFL